jgi:hypothetical protein
MRIRNILRWVLIFAIVLVAASILFSRFLQTGSARQYLLAHLASSFGRPVDASKFEFSLFDGARLTARSITVSEDPHFGNEYFLRADSLTAGLRWSALLAGRFEFGSLSLSRPSLNLVRDAQGRWNMERWLPPAELAATHAVLPGLANNAAKIPTARLKSIYVDGGRINFKRVDDKSPFALLEVIGSVEQDNAGRWDLDLQATPMRAGVVLQDIGMLRLRGSIAGTSARLQPANLALSWRRVSLADLSRLARGFDYGMRGNLDMDLNASIAKENIDFPVNPSGAAQWSLSGVARLTGIHGWRLPERPKDPAVNLSLDADWHLGEKHAQVHKISVEMANSHVQGFGDLNWEHGFQPELRIEPSSVGLSDVLAWYSAFRPDVAEDLSATGTVNVNAVLAGWPPRAQQGSLASSGGAIKAASLPMVLRVGSLRANISPAAINFAPIEISMPAVPSNGTRRAASTEAAAFNGFTLAGAIIPERAGIFRWPLNWNLSIQGQTPRTQDWLTFSDALAQPARGSWTAEGGLSAKMRAVRKIPPTGSLAAAPVWLGTMDFRDFAVSPVFVNQPVELSSVHVDYAATQRTITVASATAFGAAWRGTVVRKKADGAWTFDLSADTLDAAELDRWLGPRARPGFLARLTSLGAAAPATPARDIASSRVAAQGRLRLQELDVAPLRVMHFDGEVEIADRTVSVRNATGDFFGGKVAGAFDAKLIQDPSYRFEGHFDRVDLAALSSGLPSLADRFAGLASATLTLSTHGIGRANLAAALEGEGTLSAQNAQLSGLPLVDAVAADVPDSSTTRFAAAQGKFRISGSSITLTSVLLDHERKQYQVDGQVTFSHALDLRVAPVIATTKAASAGPTAAAGFLLRGTLEKPSRVLQNAEPTAVVRSSVRAR